MTKDEITGMTQVAVGDRVRAAVKPVLEQVIEEVGQIAAIFLTRSAASRGGSTPNCRPAAPAA